MKDSANEMKLFVSDVHYGAFSGKRAESLHHDLVTLLEFAADHRIRLTLLGDLFDWWMEYPGGHYPAYADELLESISSYTAVMGTTLAITGNHDNWTRDYLETAGLELEPEYRTIELGGKRGVLLHGDGLSEKRMGLPRPFSHRLLRHSLFVNLYQTVFPPDRGLALMKWFSEWSRSRSMENPARLTEWAHIYTGKTDIDFVICGHDHTPRIVPFPDGTLYNCGAFMTQRTLIKYTRAGFEIVIWDSEKRQLTPFDPQVLHSTKR